MSIGLTRRHGPGRHRPISSGERQRRLIRTHGPGKHRPIRSGERQIRLTRRRGLRRQTRRHGLRGLRQKGDDYPSTHSTYVFPQTVPKFPNPYSYFS